MSRGVLKAVPNSGAPDSGEVSTASVADEADFSRDDASVKNTSASETPATEVPTVAAAPGGFLPVAVAPLADADATPPAFWCVAAHGGAGATTLAQLWAPAGDAGQMWPAQDKFTSCVIVCRSTMTGLDAAHSAILQASKPGFSCRVLGVVVVADAPGKLPKVLRQRVTVLQELTKLWNIDYHEGIRGELTKDLATWIPSKTAPESTKRRQKVGPITDEVPPAVVQVAHDVFMSAFEAAKAVRASTTQKESK